MPFYIINDNITNATTDIIVNSANHQPFIGEGVDLEIYTKAGPHLIEERKKIGDIPFGETRYTKAYGISKIKYIFHTVSPVYHETNEFFNILMRAYQSALELALELECASIAFPLLSAGYNGLYRDKAIEVAIDTITHFLKDHELDVYLVLYEPLHTSKTMRITHDLNRFLDASVSRIRSRRIESYQDSSFKETVIDANINEDIQKIFPIRTDTFQRRLFQLISQKHMSEVEVYKNANLTKQVFSKIRSDAQYKPKKTTALALAISLRLNINETNDLLMRAGYALSRSQEADVIMTYFIKRKFYDIITINIVLHEYHHPLLGSK